MDEQKLVLYDEGNQLAIQYDKTLEECSILCKETEGCKSFTYCYRLPRFDCSLRDKIIEIDAGSNVLDWYSDRAKSCASYWIDCRPSEY